jgi:hypothetical protein
MAPAWDGNPDTAIDWIMTCDDLAHLGPAIESKLPTLVTARFTGPVAAAWRAHSRNIRGPILQSWRALQDWVLKQYLGDAWVMAQRIAYSKEVFRGPGGPIESPAQYIQRRILRTRLFYRFPVNSGEETASVMENAPLPWNHVLRWSERPPIEDVLALAKQYEATLVRDWEDDRYHQKRRERHQHKQANLVAREESASEEDSSLHSDWEDDEEGAFEYSGDDQKPGITSSAFNVNRRAPFRRNPNQGRRAPYDKSIASVEKTYPFPRNDTVVSHNKPGQRCFACGSEKHWLRECPHHGEYSRLVSHFLYQRKVEKRVTIVTYRGQ